MATKALHVEIVSDLTTNAFLAALQRFIGHHGLCNDLYSDCGSNFIGASRVLDQDLRRAIANARHEAASYVNNRGIRWHFNPPSAPHFGGLWEAGVKSIKYHIRRIVAPHLLTYEELSTVVIQIVATLNSRPLCPMTNDINDLRVLTPGHFTIGRAPLSPPEPDLTNQNINRLRRWQLLQRLHQDFWNQWSTEYLSRLQQRPKWMDRKNNVLIGQIVLLRDELHPPRVWRLGRIVATHPGRDGLVRVVTLETAEGKYDRPIAKISLLPISDNDDLVAADNGLHN